MEAAPHGQQGAAQGRIEKASRLSAFAFQNRMENGATARNLLADGPAHNDGWRLDSVALQSVLRFRRLVLTPGASSTRNDAT